MGIWESLAGIVAAIGSGSAQFLDRLVQLVRAQPSGTKSVGFTVAMIALSAKMAKADGIVTSDEVIAFRQLFDVPQGEERNVERLFNLAKQDIAGFEAYAARMMGFFRDEPETLFDILDALFFIAKADGFVHEAELGYLKRVSEIFEIDEVAFSKIVAWHARGDVDPYRVLGLAPSASNEDLKSRYRQEIKETHPDRLMARGVPEEFIKIASDRVAALNAAWAQIKAERGI